MAQRSVRALDTKKPSNDRRRPIGIAHSSYESVNSIMITYKVKRCLPLVEVFQDITKSPKVTCSDVCTHDVDKRQHLSLTVELHV